MLQLPAINFADKVKTDPFQDLPEDLICAIMSHLPTESIFALRKASLHALLSTRRDGFWRWFLYDRMPWFWEIQKLGAIESLVKDWRAFYRWLDRETQPRKGMTSPLLPIANRRRIWNTITGRMASEYYTVRDAKQEPVVDNQVIPEAKCFEQTYLPFYEGARPLKTTTYFARDAAQLQRLPRWFQSINILAEGFVHVAIGFGLRTNDSDQPMWGDEIADRGSQAMSRSFFIPSKHWLSGIVVAIAPHKHRRRGAKGDEALVIDHIEVSCKLVPRIYPLLMVLHDPLS